MGKGDGGLKDGYGGWGIEMEVLIGEVGGLFGLLTTCKKEKGLV